MDAYSIHGDIYYQGYSGQAPPPGTAPVQAPPPGTAPAQPPAPATGPLAPPGVAPSPSPAPAAYYGTYPTPSYGYLPASADRWSSYPVPAAEPQPYPSYPPSTLPYDRPTYGHQPYYQEPPFPYAHNNYPGPPQAYMPLPPRGSDVTHFRKKRSFPPHQNLRTKNKPFKQPQQNFRGGSKNAQQAKRGFNADPRSFSLPFNGNHPVVNSAQVLHPFWHNRVDEAPANRSGKKRRMEERGEGRSSRHDDRRRGDKRGRPGWNKGKRKKGRNSGGERSSMDPIGGAAGNSSAEKAENRNIDGVPVVEEQSREATTWFDLHRDVRKRVQEFLHTSFERGSSQKAGMEDSQMAIGGHADVENQEAIQEAVGGDVKGDIVKNDVAAGPDGVDTTQAKYIDALESDHINVVNSDGTDEQQSSRAVLPVSNAHIDTVKSDCADSLLSDSIHSDDMNTKQLDVVDTQKSDCGDALHLVAVTVPNIGTGRSQETAGVDEVKVKSNNQKPLAELIESAYNLERKHAEEEFPRPEEMKDREERSFEFFTKLLEENKDLRNMYIDKCSSGTFECLMCHSKMKKRFSNLVSLVTHACNVLKTKKLPEHRGYGRAVCSLFGWDPYRIPKVPKAKVSPSGVESAPADVGSAPMGDTDVHAPGGDTDVHAPVGDAVEQAAVGETADEVPMGAPVDDADVSKLRGVADDSEPKDDADECAPMRDAVEQVFIKDAEEPVDKDVIMKEQSKIGNEQALFPEDVEGMSTYMEGGNVVQQAECVEGVNTCMEGGNEVVEQVEVSDTVKPLQAESEVIQDLVA